MLPSMRAMPWQYMGVLGLVMGMVAAPGPILVLGSGYGYGDGASSEISE
jgi:hypothetical protein